MKLIQAFIVWLLLAATAAAATPDYPWQRLAQTPIVTSSSTITYDVANYCYVHNGTTCTATLPPVAGNDRVDFVVFNRGSGSVTLQRAGSDNLYTSSGTATSTTIAAGSWACVYCDGTYWCVRTGGGGTTLTDSASLAAALSDETGSGAAVFSVAPTLTNPNTQGLSNTGGAVFTTSTPLTASSPSATFSQTWNNSGATFTSLLENVTNTASASGSLLMDLQVGSVSKFSVDKTGAVTAGTIPISTGVSGLGTGVATWAATPSSANLSAALTDETGSGAAVFGTSPTLVTPILGTPASGNLANCTGGATFVRNIILPTAFSPADATNYFGGAGTSWQSAGGFARMYITSNCTLKKVYGWLQGANGTNEASSMYVRVNNSSDTLISSSIACNAISTVAAFNNTSMSLSLTAGDYIEIKWTTPTWATNPTGVNGAFSLEFTQ
jgi:hypothetical protein